MKITAKLTALAFALALPSTQALAASAFDPSARFPSRDAYCVIVQSLSGALYWQVDGLAKAFHTTYTDVITHRPDAVNLGPGGQNVDYVGMIEQLKGWDTAEDKAIESAEAYHLPLDTIDRIKRLSAPSYVKLIGDECRRDELRAVAGFGLAR